MSLVDYGSSREASAGLLCRHQVEIIKILCVPYSCNAIFFLNEPILHFVMGTGLLCGSYLSYCFIVNQLQRRTAEIHLFNKAFFFSC